MRFIGYSLDGTTILDNTTITVNFSQIVYAVYEELNFIRYCYSFDDYKDMNSNIYKVVGYITGENLGSLAPENPTKSNYSFMGWSTDGTTILDLSTIVNDGTISYLYAVWEASSYDIQVSLDGGIMTLNDTSYSEDFTISARFDEIISLSEPSKSLYAFDFWRVYVEHKDGTIGLLCDNSNFNTTIHELIDEHNSSYNVQFGDISFIETVYSISIVAIYVPNTDNPELLSDAELIKYVADSNLCLVYLEYPTTCEEMVRSMYLNIGFGDYETASLFDIMTILNTGYQFNAEITEETTARDFLEIAYIYIWETENQ